MVIDSSSEDEEEPLKEGDHQGKVRKIFRDRLRKDRRRQKKNMPISDQVDFDDPQNISEYQQAAYETMRKDEL